MDEGFQQNFLGIQELDMYCQNGKLEDMPLSNEFLDSFGMDSYQAAAPGGLPSPNSTNLDLPCNGQQSPLWRSLSPFASACDFQQCDGSSGAQDETSISRLLQQFQESNTNIDSNTSSGHPSTNQTLPNASSSSSKTGVQQGECSMPSSSFPDVQTAVATSDGSLSNSFQGCTPAVPSRTNSIEQIAPGSRPASTHMPITPKSVNNTLSASASANQQHSPTPKAQQFVRHPSHLRHQIHPELPQHSLLTAAATDDCGSGRQLQNMSPNSHFTNGAESHASPSHGDYQNLHYASNRPHFRRVHSNQSRGSPVLQRYQPFNESSLRSPVTSNSELNFWDVEQYPDPQPIFQQHADCSPHSNYQYISDSQKNCMNSYSLQQSLMQPNHSRNSSFMSQGPGNFDFNGSSPMTMKYETSSPGSDHLVSTPIFESPLASPKSQKKRRVRQEFKNKDQNEAAVDPVALQTADLTNLDPTDHQHVAALIDAMHNADNVEDNQGMQKTWGKVRRVKAFRIKEVCLELLNLTKQAQQQSGTPLGEKRPINQYKSFEERFDALRETLMYQKTVCKHLIEPPYSYSVVDDPHHAKDRVKNNRRVNHQKAEAIRLGREHLGEKGQGKGKPMLKTKKRAHAQLEDSQGDGEYSWDEPLSDVETDELPHITRPKSARPHSRAPKKTKRSPNSAQHEEHSSSIHSSYPPQVQDLEDPFIHGQGQPLTEQHDPSPSDFGASHPMPTLNQGFDFQPRTGPGKILYTDSSTAAGSGSGSESSGLGAPAREYN